MKLHARRLDTTDRPARSPAAVARFLGRAVQRSPAAMAALLLGTGCAPASGQPPPPQPSTETAPRAAAVDVARTNTGQGLITTFAVSPENLTVDRISMREGAAVPDGNRDLVFTTTLEGPFDALYLGTCTAKGETLHSFLADTVIGREELPAELGTVIDVGTMTEWIAASENGKFLNHENGKITISEGRHALTLYVPNTGMLRGGTFLRLYGRTPQGALVRGPVVPY